MKRTDVWFAVLLVFAVGILVSCGGSEHTQQAPRAAPEKIIVLKIASVLPADHPSSKALEFFKTRLAEISNGTMEVQLFLNSQLGDTTESIQNCQGGNIQIVFASTAPLSQFVPEFNALGMPYIYRDKAHEFAVVDGEIGRKLADNLEEFSLHKLCYFDAGSRNLMTKKGPITKPEDLKGLKIRVMPSKVMIDSINALGASAVPMSQGEVYGALQTGVLDGWENNPPTALSFKMYETGCVYYAWTRHLSVPDMLLINRDFYQKLSDEQQVLLEKIAVETVAKQRQLWKENENDAVTKLKEQGMKFNEVELTAFSSLIEPVYQESYKKYGKDFQDICEAIRNLK